MKFNSLDEWPGDWAASAIEVGIKNWDKLVQTINPYFGEMICTLGGKRVDRELTELLDLPVAFIGHYGDRVVGVIEAIRLTSHSTRRKKAIFSVEIYLTAPDETGILAVIYTSNNPENPHVWSNSDAGAFKNSIRSTMMRRQALSSRFTARMVAQELERS